MDSEKFALLVINPLSFNVYKDIILLQIYKL